jgi:uncharacterized membrane protein YfcA
MLSLLLLLLLGLVTGFFAGLFGIGGGAIMVPALTAFFLWQGVAEDQVVHMALATSLSVILFNSIISVKTHLKHQAVLGHLLVHLVPSVIVGSALASWLALQLTGQTVAFIFMVLMLIIAVQMVFDFKPKSLQAPLLTSMRLWPAGLVIGLLSALIAIGGGSLTVPFLHWHRVPIQKAIGTAAALGFFIALSGTVTYLILTWKSQEGGYVYWPATLVIVVAAFLSTRLGASMTHRLPTRQLRIGFAVLIILLALRMYFSR